MDTIVESINSRFKNYTNLHKYFFCADPNRFNCTPGCAQNCLINLNIIVVKSSKNVTAEFLRAKLLTL